jgi:hypothetical protein
MIVPRRCSLHDTARHAQFIHQHILQYTLRKRSSSLEILAIREQGVSGTGIGAETCRWVRFQSLSAFKTSSPRDHTLLGIVVFCHRSGPTMQHKIEQVGTVGDQILTVRTRPGIWSHSGSDTPIFSIMAGVIRIWELPRILEVQRGAPKCQQSPPRKPFLRLIRGFDAGVVTVFRVDLHG